ncbi:hypothetical protein [Veillonella sp.]
MEIIKWFGFNTIPIGIIISIFLLIYGKIKHIKYLDPEVPLGRLLFFVGNTFAMDSKTITEDIMYIILGYSFCIYGFTFFFMTGMRRSYDIGLPFWIYPLFIVVTSLSRLVDEDIFQFLLLGMYIFLLEPGRNNN